MEVNLFVEDVEVPGLDSEFFLLWFDKVCNAESKKLDTINLILCSDDYLLSLNKEHLNHDYYTDIITFDYSNDMVISGDLFISWDRVVENATTFNVPQIDELHRVAVHGLLHLCGYKDKLESEESLMREKENLYLSIR